MPQTKVPAAFEYRNPEIIKQLPWIVEDEITAYRLCEYMLEAVYAEPRRFHMGTWFRNIPERDSSYIIESLDSGTGQPHPAAACKTVACESGWLGIMAELDTPNDSAAVIKLMTGYHAWDSQWRDSAIPEPVIAAQLDQCFMRFPLHPDLGGPQVGTKEYVDAATGPFKSWMTLHKEFLKARVLRRNSSMGYGFQPVPGTRSV